VSDSRPIYAVPTHLRQREPMVLGRTVGELAKLLVVALVAARLASSSEFPGVLRFAAAGLVLLLGAGWALVRIQGYSLDEWLGLVFKYGARPKLRVWRPGRTQGDDAQRVADRMSGSWFDVERVRVRWAPGDRHSADTTGPKGLIA